ncbi:MAG: DUF5131 family protein [Mesorhizobium sp.]|uniref:phage Gp37/Gp68 family protein n=1 Tax=unclassified Mesorhizobium TaxID=325217 RepID=UPI000FC9AD49|nr:MULTISPECIES: phage Gp37/Gp68 family protein [unclassified Mesorhizobium]RUV13566.1 phage Gp37/Gp68 family protein [Mesorhizobium sp. M1A.F.Ca.IN.022.04.1.1]RUV63522.1 phage Gp37/Gp68 family protein [Mesorhizobium sp. M1A.F.Ca.IN.022.02.1.1]RWG27384.1 MAG: phage Gp37/Gp68 family protein [Mesorhizobium sp.]RWH26991.1 MAG: phage Gp37/Gp68 family protein [Mesorhizobium sp.]TIM35982.1 MAG: DUF5131 family protein [Mesorhizobium sp.]
MADKSAIEWTDATWNPIVGCSILSPGCTHCYAMGMAGRIEAMTAALRKEGKQGAPHYDGTTKKVNGKTVWTGKLAMAPEAILREPLAWKRPRRIFVNSMGDLFHEDVPDEWIDRVFAVMALAPQHTFQVLTKRAKRMREYLTKPVSGPWAGRMHSVDDSGKLTDFTDARRRVHEALVEQIPKTSASQLNLASEMQEPHGDGFMPRWPLPNVWLGVSAERQQEADERIPELLATPAAIRFVSAEPLLGPIDFERIKLPGIINPLDVLRGMTWQQMTHGKYAGQRLYSGLIFGGDRGLDWIIVGGESGPNARPMHPAWARSIRDQCEAAGVPFFFKQWGAWAPASDASREIATVLPDGRVREWDTGEGRLVHPDMVAMSLVGKKAAGRLLDGIEHNGMPELREVPAL